MSSTMPIDAKFNALYGILPDCVTSDFIDDLRNEPDDEALFTAYCERTADYGVLFARLMAKAESWLSNSKLDEIRSQLEHIEISHEVNSFFDDDELTEGESWDNFERHLERNEAAWREDDRMAMYLNEH